MDIKTVSIALVMLAGITPANSIALGCLDACLNNYETCSGAAAEEFTCYSRASRCIDDCKDRGQAPQGVLSYICNKLYGNCTESNGEFICHSRKGSCASGGNGKNDHWSIFIPRPLRDNNGGEYRGHDYGHHP